MSTGVPATDNYSPAAASDIGAEDWKKKRILSMAFGDSIRSALIYGSLASVATVLATRNIERFNKYLSISAKTSLPVMTVLFVFTLQYELTIHDCQRNPSRYGAYCESFFDMENDKEL